MKKLVGLLGGAFKTARGRSIAVGFAAFMALSAFLAPMASAEGLGGKEIAEDFITPMTTKFEGAIPIILGFLALLAGVGMLIKLIQSRGKSKNA